MNLAPNLPEDPVMQQLLQLLHEEIGLPKHKTISLQTSLNFDLACDGVEAKQFMEALEQDFGVDLATTTLIVTPTAGVRRVSETARQGPW